MIDSEVWKPRGIGSDYGLRCFVTGAERDLMPNISGFVTSKESGERVVAMFGGLARLDFRPSEPNWIQVKVGALPEHMSALQDLYRYAVISGRVTPKAIEAAKTSSPFAEIADLKTKLDEARRKAIEECAAIADRWTSPEQRLHGHGGAGAEILALLSESKS